MKKVMLVLVVIFLFSGCTGIESSELPEHPIESETSVSAPMISVEQKILSTSEQNMIINTIPDKYSYESFLKDIQLLKFAYGENLNIVKLADTADSRGVYDLRIGDEHSQKQILIVGAMHAREYITSQVVMRQLCECLDALNGFCGEYRGIPVKELMEGVTIHFVPFSNPDGIVISQFGANALRNENLKTSVPRMASGNDEQWKANAIGIDLNRNFDADWDSYVGAASPGSERYKGVYPGSESESAALIKLTKQYPIKRTISYHTCGALIYWYFKQEGQVLIKSQKFAQTISDETGYYLDDDFTAVDAAGYKDWAVYKMGIPSLTIEVGAEEGRSIVNPVPIERFGEIWNRNRNVVFATIYNLKFE